MEVALILCLAVIRQSLQLLVTMLLRDDTFLVTTPLVTTFLGSEYPV
jgi:hypothetical protein